MSSTFKKNMDPNAPNTSSFHRALAAGAPSSPSQPPPPSLPVPSSPTPPPPPALHISTDFADGSEFIQLELSSDEESTREERPADAVKGKQRASNGLNKRKFGVFDEGRGEGRGEGKPHRRSITSRTTPWMKYVNWDGCLNSAEMLQREVKAFARYIAPTSVEHEIRAMIIQLVRKSITSAFPDAELIPFGSYETQLYLPRGDIDLVLRSTEMAKHDKKRVLYSLSTVIKRAGITNKVTVIANAKVPIIKFDTHIGNLSVDISINQENGIVARDLINSYLESMPALRSLVLVIKTFLSERGINEVFSGGLGSYSTVLLVISFLQMHPKVRRAEIDPSENLGVLLNEFLELYGKYFNYSAVGISIQDGGTYFNKNGEANARFMSLSIDDPCDPSNDVSKGSFAMSRVRSAFAGAHEALTLALLKKAQNLLSLRQDYYSQGGNYNSRTEPDYSSILGSIIGITEQTSEHRQLMDAIWNDGQLHKLLGKANPVKSQGRRERARRSSRDRIHSKTSRAKFSMDEEMEMEVSDGEILEQGRVPLNDSDGENESKYTIARQRPDSDLNARTSRVEYIAYEDASDADVDDDDAENLAINTPLPPSTSTPKARKSNGVKLRRNREYWASKSG